MKMSQREREWKESHFNDVSHNFIFLKGRLESTEEPVADYCFFVFFFKVHRETFKKPPELKVMPVKLPTARVSAPANLISLH